MDKLNTHQRSENMRRIKSKDTVPELLVRRVLRSERVRYTQRTDRLPGKPDFLVCEGRVAIFVHGCFWHQHARCADGRRPKSRLDYWGPKLDSNLARDRRVRRQLRRARIFSIVLWECEVLDAAALAHQLRTRLTRSKKHLRLRETQAGY